MDLKRRLAGLDRMTRKPGSETASPRVAGDPGAVMADLGLREMAGPAGRVWIRDYADPLPPPADCLPDLAGFFTHAVAGRVAPADILFVDTETTGLAGGTGTIPFLVGVSWWEDAGLRTRQFFLPGPGRERAVLAALEEMAAPRRVVVTFNGASFDLPLLRTRARLERSTDPLAHAVSWDLLVPARRLWGRILPDCRQQTLEREILGRERGTGDIDGSRIPQTWFDFLSTGLPGELPAVLRHNRRDMTGMAELLLAVLGARAGLDAACAGSDLTWRDAWARGRICEQRREDAAAAAWLAQAWDLVAQGRIGTVHEAGFYRDAVRILKRKQDWTRVAAVLADGIAARPGDRWLHREAAILYEHRLVDLDRALGHALDSGENRRSKRLEVKISRRYGDRDPSAKGREG